MRRLADGSGGTGSGVTRNNAYRTVIEEINQGKKMQNT